MQLSLADTTTISPSLTTPPGSDSRDRLARLLQHDLGFHGQNTVRGLHNMHAFPAKFPPQLPRLFIEHLTSPGDIVLDPMLGSGTTVIESILMDRYGLGCDIDPMAINLCRAKTSPLRCHEIRQLAYEVMGDAREQLEHHAGDLWDERASRFDAKTLAFLDYWFLPRTQLELLSLIREIEGIVDEAARTFLTLCFSAIIITKSGGVSLARDLAHTRPHFDASKTPRDALSEFRTRVDKNSLSLQAMSRSKGAAGIVSANAQSLPFADEAVDLIVTSPPYAANAIDYMRAHKFALVWLQHKVDDLSVLRGKYIGGDSTQGFPFVGLPPRTVSLVEAVRAVDISKSAVLHRYYSEMTRALAEMHRVLKQGKACIVVVGSSTMRGIDTRTQECLGEIGESIGFDLVGIATRQLDRNRRMMPARHSGKRESMIEERMHEEYVIGFQKPRSANDLRGTIRRRQRPWRCTES